MGGDDRRASLHLPRGRVLLRRGAGATRRDDGRAAGRQQPLVVERVATVDGLAYGEVHDCIAKELEALVVGRRRVRVLVEIAAVDESLVEEPLVGDIEPEPRRECSGRAHGSRVRGG